MINKETIKVLVNDINQAFEADVINGGSSGNNPLARFALSYVLREVLDCSYKYAGELMGRRCPSVKNYVGRHHDLIKFDKEYKALFNKIQLDDYRLLTGGMDILYIRNYVKHFKEKIEYYNNEVRELKRLKRKFYPNEAFAPGSRKNRAKAGC